MLIKKINMLHYGVYAQAGFYHSIQCICMHMYIHVLSNSV